MGGNIATLLLVCRQWTTIVYSSPRLWSRIAVTDNDSTRVRLKGALRCTDLNQLHSALSRSRSSPLQIEISFRTSHTMGNPQNSSRLTSIEHGPLAGANRAEAVKVILDNQVLRRCTFIALGSYFLTLRDQRRPIAGHKDMPILPLLSSLYMDSYDQGENELLFLQSLVTRSPLLLHIHYECYMNLREHCLSPQHLGEGNWTKRVETYSWLTPFEPCHILHESPSLRELGIAGKPTGPLTLPALQVLRWALDDYSGFQLVTAPHLHTLILDHPQYIQAPNRPPPPAGSISLPSLRIAMHRISNLNYISIFQTPALEHLSIQSKSSSSPLALFDLFDGSAHMPTPKSLHLDCPFTDAALIAVLGRLPWLEELQIAGTIAQGAFWEGLTPDPHPGEHENRVLIPNLKSLLVNYSTGDLYIPPEFLMRRWTFDGHSMGGAWTVERASAVSAAREKAGCSLETLACWSPNRKVEMLIGNLDSLPERPKYVY